ncbi:MAG: polyprenyl synthetase family protein [Flammeovirgaceae bacterium]
MFDIQKASALIQREIDNLPLSKQPQNLYDPIRYLMNLGGKRLRPLLVILGSYLVNGKYEDILQPAVAVEVFHNFTLMHDDIMDNAPLRRGKATVHEKWNRNVAILSGDVMLVQAYGLMLDIEPNLLPKILTLFNRCASEVCEGQQWDMDFESLPTVSETQYLDMIRLKTAVLLGFSLQLGALLAGNEKVATQLYSFGVNIGIGFQLKDDLLDVYGNAEKFGKQVGGDIISNKKTFLLIKALEKAKGEQAEKLNYWLSLKQFDAAEKVNVITEIYNQLKIREITTSKMNEFFEKGFMELEQINVSSERKKVLEDFTRSLIDRDK